MKYLVWILPLFLIVNLVGMRMHNMVVLSLSVVILAIYFAGEGHHQKSGQAKMTIGEHRSRVFNLD